MLPGYGFSPFPDFQPHLRCRGESASMWIPGSGDSPALSESQEDRRLPFPCHHKHVAVCQQETLSFIELQPPASPKLNGLVSPRPTTLPDARCATQPLTLNGFRQALNELNDAQNGCHGTEGEDETPSATISPLASAGDDELQGPDAFRICSQEQSERPVAVTTVCRPLHAPLSLPLTLPLSALYTNRDSWESQSPCSPSPPEGSGVQSLYPGQPQRRTSQGSLKEKSIRKSDKLQQKLKAMFLLDPLKHFSPLIARAKDASLLPREPER